MKIKDYKNKKVIEKKIQIKKKEIIIVLQSKKIINYILFLIIKYIIQKLKYITQKFY